MLELHAFSLFVLLPLLVLIFPITPSVILPYHTLSRYYYYDYFSSFSNNKIRVWRADDVKMIRVMIRSQAPMFFCFFLLLLLMGVSLGLVPSVWPSGFTQFRLLSLIRETSFWLRLLMSAPFVLSNVNLPNVKNILRKDLLTHSYIHIKHTHVLRLYVAFLACACFKKWGNSTHNFVKAFRNMY